MKSGKFKRFSKLGTSLVKATGHIALDVVKTKAQELAPKASQKAEEARQYLEKPYELGRKAMAAKEIISSMGELKGAVMKLGQMISITEDLIIPPEISKLFKELQKNAPPMPKDDLINIFKEEFDKSPFEIYKEFDPTPIAAASIGQVHKALTFNDELVAVKVQYPKIVKAIEHDFENMDKIISLMKLLFPNSPKPDSYIVELKRSLLEECDYLKEAEHIEFFNESLNSEFPNILIPKVYKDLTTKKVLTMEFMEGDTFEETLKYPIETRNDLAQLHYDAHMFMLYNLKSMHTDPQNGNFLFKGNKIIMLDFGSVRAFPDDFIEIYKDLLISVENDDYEDYRDFITKMQILSESDDEEMFEKHYKLLKTIYLPYTKPGLHKIHKSNPFEMIHEFIKGVKVKGREAPREEFLLLDRANFGLYAKIRSWDASIDWVNAIKRYR